MAAESSKLVRDVARIKAGSHSLFLGLKLWRRFKCGKPALKWNRVRFDKANRASVPKKAGIYAFLLEVETPSLPPHGYLLYVGKTGADGSSNTLYGRFGNYLHEKDSARGRAPIRYMFANWDGELTFYYTIVDKRRISSIEDKLIAATQPPINRHFVDADLAAAKKAEF